MSFGDQAWASQQTQLGCVQNPLSPCHHPPPGSSSVWEEGEGTFFFKDKKETDLKYDYFITSKRLNEKEPLLAWGKQLIPHEENILRGVSGEWFFLYSRQSFIQQKLSADEKKNLGIELSLNDKLKRAFDYFRDRLSEKIKLKKRKVK